MSPSIRTSVPTESKPCAVCGRMMQWRKSWAKNWDDVRYCSDACRKRKHSSHHERLETAILSVLAMRADDATICPSEAARLVCGEGDWHDLNEEARSAARRLQVKGLVMISQRGKPVDPSTAKGPIRIGKVKPR